MSTQDPTTIATVPAPGTPSREPRSAGTLLREAREAAGLSLDAAAQQLKLAPRQVTALEADDFGKLPGRTFVRGFVRNYARLVHVDPDVVLAALAGSDTPALDSPALQPTAPTMGELPQIERAKPSWTRWAIPLLLIAIIAFAALWEFTRGFAEWPHLPAPRDAASAGTPPATPAGQPPAGTTEKSLANPVSGAPATGAAPPAESTNAATTATSPASAATATATAENAAVAPAPETSAEAALVFTYRKASWTEVKDGSGRVVFSQIVAAGQTRTVAGTPPFDLVIGNANDVSLTFRGQAVDLAAHTSKNVARLVLE